MGQSKTEKAGILKKLKQGLAFQNKGMTQQAANIYLEILAIVPTLPDALHLLGQCRSAQGHHHEAVTLIAQAIAQSKGQLFYKVSHARALYLAGEPQQALAALEEILQESPVQSHALCQKANILRALKREDEARTAYLQVLSQEPAHKDALLNLLDMQGGEGQKTRYLTWAASILEHWPLDQTAVALAAKQLMNLGKTHLAIKGLERALANNPNPAQEAIFTLAEAYFQIGDLTQALLVVNRLPHQIQNNVRAACFRSKVHLNQGRHDLACPPLEKAMETAQTGEQYNDIGFWLLKCGNLRLALSAFTRACALDPNRAESHHNAGLVLNQLGKNEKAKAYLERALNLNPADAAAHHMLKALKHETSDTPPEGYIRDLFDGYAPHFDQHLSQKLDYQAPYLLALLAKEFGRLNYESLLDLGCGTGLSGEAFSGYANELCGVDLSAAMLKLAQKKGIYTTLHHREILHFLRDTQNKFDLVIAVDVLNYLGNLEPLFSCLDTCLTPGADFLFSVENGCDAFELRPTGRYTHGQAYIAKLADGYGWQIRASRKEKLRKEQSRWCEGTLFALRKKAPNPGTEL